MKATLNQWMPEDAKALRNLIMGSSAFTRALEILLSEHPITKALPLPGSHTQTDYAYAYGIQVGYEKAMALFAYLSNFQVIPQSLPDPDFAGEEEKAK